MLYKIYGGVFLQKKVVVKIIKPKNMKPDINFQGLTNSGYCFVEFESFEDAQHALSLNGQLLPDIAMPSQLNFPIILIIKNISD